MVTAEVVQERLRLLSEYVEDLKAEQGITFAQYQDDKKTRRYVEHTIQVAIESCLDIGHHIIAAKHLPLPAERRDIFKTLSDADIIPIELVPTLQKMVGFRNRMVHEYEKVENEFVYGILKKNIGDFTVFGQAILKFLDREAKVGDITAPDDATGKTLRERRATYTARRKHKSGSK